MGLLTGISIGADTYATFRFLRLLTTAWEDTGAFKAGLIDDKGKILKKPETSDERSVYNIFHRLVFNVKRLINKVPFGKTTLASYITALYLIKESTGMSEDQILSILNEATGNQQIIEAADVQQGDSEEALDPAGYLLRGNMVHPKTGETIAQKNDRVDVTEAPIVGYFLNIPIFEVTHIKSKSKLLVSRNDLIS